MALGPHLHRLRGAVTDYDRIRRILEWEQRMLVRGLYLWAAFLFVRMVLR